MAAGDTQAVRTGLTYPAGPSACEFRLSITLLCSAVIMALHSKSCAVRASRVHNFMAGKPLRLEAMDGRRNGGICQSRKPPIEKPCGVSPASFH